MGITGTESTGSGIYSYAPTRDDIIKAALRKIGVLHKDDDPSASEIANAAMALNLMVKSWQSNGIALWKNKEATLYLDTNTTSYNLNAISGDNFSLGVVETELGADGDSGDSTITVDSITNIADGDYIGIELDDDSIQWTTVNGTPSGTTVTLTDVLEDDVNENDHVYVYTTKAQRPLEIIECRIRNDDDEDTPVRILSRQEYMLISDKDQDGVTNSIYYDPQLTTGVLYVWPVIEDVAYRLIMTIKYPLQDFDSEDDFADFPVEWINAIIYNLALELITEYPEADGKKIAILAEKAREYKDLAFMGNNDAEYITFCPDMG